MNYPGSRVLTDGGNPMNQMLLNYSYLQILDFLTRVAFLVNGVKEANPLVRFALTMGPSPISGLVVSKIAAVLLGFYCWRFVLPGLLNPINIPFPPLSPANHPPLSPCT